MSHRLKKNEIQAKLVFEKRLESDILTVSHQIEEKTSKNGARTYKYILLISFFLGLVLCCTNMFVNIFASPVAYAV